MRVLINGGGIAGPALAFWLHRAGVDVTVVERAAAPRPGGHAVDIRGVAREVARRMGLLETIKANTVDERGIALIDDEGRRRAEMSADMFGGEGIVAEIEIARDDLARVLREATDCPWRFGDHVVELRQHADGVDVVFASGLAQRYDVVVGADGVHSKTRALVFGPESDFVTYLGGYAAYFTVPDPGDLDHWFLMYNAPGGRGIGLRPEAGGTAKCHVSITAPDNRYDRMTRAEQQRLIAERLTGAGWKAAEMLAAMPGADDFYFDSYNQVAVDRWWRGRVVLIGDAGYCGSPLAGLGTSMSLVGAYVLAGELLGGADRDPGVAFAAYQKIMRDYVAASIKLPPGGVNGFLPKSRLRIRYMRWGMAHMTRWPMRQIMEKVVSRADAITLPDYELTGQVVYR